jgi:hypothetical protein
MNNQANPFCAVTFAANPPADPLRKAARSLEFATELSPQQFLWASQHEWFVAAVGVRKIIVRDSFTWNGMSYSDELIWGGTFAELRLWAGY